MALFALLAGLLPVTPSVSDFQHTHRTGSFFCHLYITSRQLHLDAIHLFIHRHGELLSRIEGLHQLIYIIFKFFFADQNFYHIFIFLM